MIRRNGRSNRFLTIRNVTGATLSYSVGHVHPHTPKMGASPKPWEGSRTNWPGSPKPPEQAAEMNEVGSCKWSHWQEWGYGGLGQLGILFFLFLFVVTQSGTNGVGTCFTTSGNSVNWKWSFHLHQKVTLDSTDTSLDVCNHISVYANCFICSTCT